MNVIPGRVSPFTEGTVVTTGKDTGKVILPKDPPMIIPGSVTAEGEVVAPLPPLVKSTPVPSKISSARINLADQTADAALETIKKQHEARDHGTDRKL